MNKNILIIIPMLGGGGAEKVATVIGTALNKKNNVFYLTWYNYKWEYKFSGIKICMNEDFPKYYITSIFNIIKRALQIKKISKKYNIDYCISFLEESNFPNILSKYLFKNKSKTIISIRNSIDSMCITYKTLIRLLYNKANIIIPNSNEEKENLIKKYGIIEKKIKTIHNPLDLKKIHLLSTENTKYGIFPENIFTFITIGRLVKQKNQEFLIRCFQKFSEIYKESQLLIIGDGELKDYLKKYKCKNIKFLGHQENVYKYLSKSDCFLFSSLYEGFPNAVLEAMACGLPVISTNFKTGIKEIIKNNKYGFIIESGDENKYIDKMKLLYENQELLKYYKNKSLQRCMKYDLTHIINEWNNILK